MQKTPIIEETMIKKMEKHYLIFIHAFVNFLLKFFQQIAEKHHEKNELLHFEKCLSQSLQLLDKLHMSLYQNYPLYGEYLLYQDNLYPFQTPQSKTNHTLLKQLERYISDYPFLQKNIGRLCKMNISQILNYYPQDFDDVTIVVTNNPSPWTPRPI